MVVHWTGKTWAESPTLNLGYFNGVGTDSPTDVWAVGGTNWFSPSDTLIEHYNGTNWTHVPSPSPGEGGYLRAVTAISPTDAWAVGLIGPGGDGVPGSTTPLIEHWNGTAWTRVRCPIPATGGQFYSVAASSPTDVWAVGWTGEDAAIDGQQNLIEHWNGTAWTRVPGPNPAGVENNLYGVDAISPTNAWAVGANTVTSNQSNAMILHWNGRSWKQVPSNSGASDALLNSVSGTSGHDAWAVGMLCRPQCATLALHWNGTAWSRVPTPNPAADYLNELMGVVAICPHNVWAAGTTDYANTLIAHWNGKSWS